MMAQRKASKLGRNMRVLARRYGLTTRGAIAIAVAVLLVAAASCGAINLLGSGGMRIERADNAGDTAGLAPTSAVANVNTAGERDSGSSAGVAQGTAQSTGPTDQSASAEAHEPGAPAHEGASASHESTRILVHVDGAVVAPGVYVLEEPDPRINDAVTHAGGLTPEADTSTVNLAARVSDGEKVHVPVAGEAPVEVTVGEGTADPSASHGEGTNADAGQAAPTGEGGLVNVNTASEQELCELPGIGEVTAAAIVREREANGPYASVDDVMRVSGIGEKKLAKIRDLICV